MARFLICDICGTDKEVNKDRSYKTILQYFRYDLCDKCEKIIETRVKQENDRIIKNRDDFAKHLLD